MGHDVWTDPYSVHLGATHGHARHLSFHRSPSDQLLPRPANPSCPKPGMYLACELGDVRAPTFHRDEVADRLNQFFGRGRAQKGRVIIITQIFRKSCAPHASLPPMEGEWTRVRALGTNEASVKDHIAIRHETESVRFSNVVLLFAFGADERADRHPLFFTAQL